MMDDKKRRHRGSSPFGDFEQSKKVAVEEERKKREAEKLKTERLGALRLAQIQQQSKNV
ncbi:hypothetical protein [Pararhizobium arenae]|uniref:hypothetical protein n=1 Tax=Pararhizobium arenae TaxID=1856850 RepID=UPI001301436E|nr:hypothetical protein [Pararhizobium arenae]